ncbi:MAG: four helix bundle protein [Mangrovibacterium sp.]
MADSIVKKKSFDFAVRITNMYKYLTNEKKEFVLSKQLLRSGTSVGANVREALNAESPADFAHKLGIAQKEADETSYWLELLNMTSYISEKEFESINDDVNELLKIIRSIILTTRQKQKLAQVQSQNNHRQVNS